MGIEVTAQVSRHPLAEARDKVETHRAQQARDVVGGGQQRAGTVLARQAEFERLEAGHQARPITIGGPSLFAHLGEPVLEVAQRGGRGPVLGVQALLAGVEAGFQLSKNSTFACLPSVSTSFRSEVISNLILFINAVIVPCSIPLS